MRQEKSGPRPCRSPVGVPAGITRAAWDRGRSWAGGGLRLGQSYDRDGCAAAAPPDRDQLYRNRGGLACALEEVVALPFGYSRGERPYVSQVGLVGRGEPDRPAARSAARAPPRGRCVAQAPQGGALDRCRALAGRGTANPSRSIGRTCSTSRPKATGRGVVNTMPPWPGPSSGPRGPVHPPFRRSGRGAARPNALVPGPERGDRLQKSRCSRGCCPAVSPRTAAALPADDWRSRGDDSRANA